MFIKDNQIQLLPDHSILIHTDKKILVAADIHLGKSATFRAHGLPVPEGDTQRDLTRLSLLILTHKPEHLVIAGDLFHSPSGQTEITISHLTTFLQHILIPLTLVQGNHDTEIKNLPTEIEVLEHFDTQDIRIIHNPAHIHTGQFHITGHIHPTIKIRDGKNTSLRLPCFHLHNNTLTLPSFGSFTGGHIIAPKPHHRFFISHNNSVIELPPSLL